MTIRRWDRWGVGVALGLCLVGSAAANDALLGQELPGGQVDPELARPLVSPVPRAPDPGISVAPNRSRSERFEAIRRAGREAAAQARLTHSEEVARLAGLEAEIQAQLATLENTRGEALHLARELAAEELAATRAGAEAEAEAAEEERLLAKIGHLEGEFADYLQRQRETVRITATPGAGEAVALRRQVESARERLAEARRRQEQHQARAGAARAALVSVQRDQVHLEALVRDVSARRDQARAAAEAASDQARRATASADGAALRAWWARRLEEAEAVVVAVELQVQAFVLRNRPF